MNFTLNDRAVNFELKDSRSFQLNAGSVSFTLNAIVDGDGFRLLEEGFFRDLEDDSGLRLLE
jgi:hypothetical protein